MLAGVPLATVRPFSPQGDIIMERIVEQPIERPSVAPGDSSSGSWRRIITSFAVQLTSPWAFAVVGLYAILWFIFEHEKIGRAHV